MRLYSFVNFYLSSIQQGIQTAHLVGEMSQGAHTGQFDVWANSFKTIIVLNGGNNKSLLDLRTTLQAYSEFPVGSFSEDDESLGGVLTCVGIIVPDYIWEDIDRFRAGEDAIDDPERTAEERALVELIAGHSLAR